MPSNHSKAPSLLLPEYHFSAFSHSEVYHALRTPSTLDDTGPLWTGNFTDLCPYLSFKVSQFQCTCVVFNLLLLCHTLPFLPPPHYHHPTPTSHPRPPIYPLARFHHWHVYPVFMPEVSSRESASSIIKCLSMH